MVSQIQKASEAGSGTISSEAWLGARRLVTAQVGAWEQAGRSGEAAGEVGDKHQGEYYYYKKETDDDDDDDDNDDDYKSPPCSPKGSLNIDWQ